MTEKKAEPVYAITESEMNQIKNDCLYPERSSCDGCECAEGIDETRASGLGCTFKGANILMDEVLSRGPLSCNIMTCPGATDMCMERNGAQEEITIREVTDEEAEKEILDYYRTYCDASHYPDVVALDLRLDLEQTMRICDKLMAEQKIEVWKQAQPQDAAGKAELEARIDEIEITLRVVGDIFDRYDEGEDNLESAFNEIICHLKGSHIKYDQDIATLPASPCKAGGVLAELELRMIEALEHVASTGSMDAMNAYIAECRKQAEERAKENQNGETN